MGVRPADFESQSWLLSSVRLPIFRLVQQDPAAGEAIVPHGSFVAVAGVCDTSHHELRYSTLQYLSAELDAALVAVADRPGAVGDVGPAVESQAARRSWQTLRLPPAFVTDTNFVAIAPSWMSDPVQRKGTLYLTYRLARGEDAGLNKYMDGRVNIHFYTGNMALTSRNYTLLLGNITQGSQWPPAAVAGTARYPWHLLVVAASTPRNFSSVEGMIATVQVCRFTTQPGECGTPPAVTSSVGGGDAAFSTRSAAVEVAVEDDAIADYMGGSSPPDVGSTMVAEMPGVTTEASAVCGDGVCAQGAESKASCAADCCDRGSATCGDGRCDAWAGESCISCPSDCARVRADGGGDVLPFPIDTYGRFQYTAHDTSYSSAAVQWHCCGGGTDGDGCGAAGCTVAGGSDGGDLCRMSCADPGPLARLRSLLWSVASA
ncbi:hypothetical protein TSOC_003195 [Tetrabaena socialis]|uniref:Peptidase M11 gametolysin domain-containing protein n=1 Tax=Tetrabaena socialis TaxID=47790 RepID=A0A2J8AC61_9CHLO|nr:hypothetical protein TSOC_003195 [Tetrabaena socialis]|eukprot:PNH10112.1 hypothetical protein TSOC_003195 [Tetrabaena socialis]